MARTDWTARCAQPPYDRLPVPRAAIAAAFGLAYSDLRQILTDCDLPTAEIARRQLNPKGFWHLDKGKHPELRHTVLTLVAFEDLESHIRKASGDRDAGIQSFLSQNHGEGWLLPETLRLADHGLGHDDRARESQRVAIRLGPRFYEWQLAQGPEETRLECRLHARNLLGEEEYRALVGSSADGAARMPNDDSTMRAAEPTPDYKADDSAAPPQRELLRRSQPDLFQ